MLNIDGAYRFCEVRINRQLVCMHRGGYSPFLVDLTGKVKPGVNTLHLTTNCAMLPASRWYTGAGLYRSVELLTGDAPCIAPRGVRVRRTAVHGDRVELEVHTELIGPMTAVIHTLYDAEGSRVAQGGDGVLIIRGAKLWSDAHPYLYTLKSQVMLPSGAADEVVTRVGLRTIEVDAARGLRINGEPVKLRGGCIHHDNGPLGDGGALEQAGGQLRDRADEQAGKKCRQHRGAGGERQRVVDDVAHAADQRAGQQRAHLGAEQQRKARGCHTRNDQVKENASQCHKKSAVPFLSSVTAQCSSASTVPTPAAMATALSSASAVRATPETRSPLTVSRMALVMASPGSSGMIAPMMMGV